MLDGILELCVHRRGTVSPTSAVVALLCAAALWLALAGVARAQAAPQTAATPTIPSPLALDQALRIFREHGFDLLLADAAVQGAEGDLVAAAALPNPMVAASAGHTYTYRPSLCDVPGCSATPLSANVSDQGLLFDLAIGKRRLRRDVAAQAVEAARASRDDARRTLTAMVKQQYALAVLAQGILGFAREAAATSAKTASLVDIRLRAGDASEADAARAQTSALSAQQAVDSASESLTSAKAALAFLLGVRTDAPSFELDAALPPVAPRDALQGATTDSLSDLAREHRPDLVAARAQVASAQATLALAKRQRLPDVSVVAGYQQEGHGQAAIQPPTATLGLALPLPLFYRGAGEITHAEATLRAQTLQLHKLEAQIGTDVSTSFAAYTSARSRVERMQGSLLEQSRRARDLVAYQYTKGAASLFELLEAQQTYVEVTREYFQDVGDYWTALYGLEGAVGMEF